MKFCPGDFVVVPAGEYLISAAKSWGLGIVLSCQQAADEMMVTVLWTGTERINTIEHHLSWTLKSVDRWSTFSGKWV